MKTRRSKVEDRKKYAIRKRSHFGFRISAFSLLFVLNLLSLLAADTNLAPDSIPPLRPPRAELPPTFWEQHSSGVLVVGFVLLLVLAGLVWLLLRPKPVVPTPPVVVAREALAPLSGLPETGLLLSQTSQILRHYIRAAFELPAEQQTTSEFCQLLTAHPTVGEELTMALGEFLRRSDLRKFTPAASLPALGAVSEALKLIEQCEARLGQLRQTAVADSRTPPIAAAVRSSESPAK